MIDKTKALRSVPPDNPFHIVLVEPEIPGNTGNIARLCVATNSILHLVGKLGFDLTDKAVRRSGCNYIPLADIRNHSDMSECVADIASGNWWYFSGHCGQNYYDVKISPGDVFVFGKESTGLPEDLLEEKMSQVVALPMPGQVRSLNLANTASVVVYDALRQVGAFSCAEFATISGGP